MFKVIVSRVRSCVVLPANEDLEEWLAVSGLLLLSDCTLQHQRCGFY